MKRYKTGLGVLCGNGHQNLVDDRQLAESPEEAKNKTLLAIQRMKCHWCEALLTNRIQLLGIEEISLHPVFVNMGYVCKCGERVPVLTVEEGRQFDIPADSVTVQCSKGHPRTVQNREFPGLQTWMDQTQ